jgi:hypothetical protein
MKSNTAPQAAQAPPDPLSIRPLIAAEVDRLRDEILEVVGARPIQKLLDTSEVSQFLGVTSQTVGKLRSQGLPFLKIGEVYRYDVDAIREWAKGRGQ